MNALNIILILAGLMACAMVVSGYKEDFSLMTGNYPNVFTDSFVPKNIEKKEVCDPGFNCRRINFYCTKYN